MINLVSVTDKIRLVSTAAVPLDVHADFVDWVGSTPTPGRQNTEISTATTTDIVSPPGASTSRAVQELAVKNVHGASSQGVTVQHTDGTTTVEVDKRTLLAGESLVYRSGKGWVHRDANGGEK